MIRPGELRERVTIQTATQVNNSLGEATFTWADSQTIWASVNGVSSREALADGQQESRITHRVRFRYVSGLKHTDRLVWRDRVLEIISLLEYENRSEHVAICAEFGE